jgi:colanic acid biosynthesis glycosyl transferase WcaI
LHLFSFALSSLPLLFRHLFWRPQIILVVAPALFCAPGAWFAARLSGARCWLHIQDFEVDAAFELGLIRGARLRAAALGLERWLLRRFDRVSSISLRMVERLRDKGVASDRIVLFPNWVDLSPTSRMGESKSGDFRAELGIAADAVVSLYSGSMGNKQGLEILAEVARRLQAKPELVFVFCGNGSGRGDLEQACAGLDNVRFLELQPLENLGILLGMADIHLLPQRADAADLVMPSKLTGMLASGRPVIATAAPGTQVAMVVEQCGLVVPPGDAEALANAVLALVNDVSARREMGAKARAYAEANLDRDAVLAKFERELRALIKSRTDFP